MAYPVFYVEAGDTLPVLFDSFDGGTGASITMTGILTSDIEIYKDGGVTQRSSDNGYALLDTDGIDFDGITGIHGFSINLGDNTDVGFYAVGPWYHVVISSITIDGQTVNFVACAFRIVSATRGLAGTALPDAAADAAGGVPISDAGGLDIDTKLAATNEVTAARMAALTDWINGGRLDLLLDAIPTTAMRGTDSAALASEVTATRMSELDDSAGKLVAIADLIQTAVDAIKLETDKLTLGDAGAGSAGSIIEEIENRPTTAMRGTDGVDTATMRGTDSVVLSGPTKAEMDTAHALLATPAQVNTEVDSAFLGNLILRRNTAQAGANASITLDSGASAVNDYYRFLYVGIFGGTGAGQAKLILGYNGTSKVATIGRTDWATNPDSTSVFVLFIGGSVDIRASGIAQATFTGNAINASAIAADAIGASQFANDAVQEITRAINPRKNSAFSNITFEMYDSTNHNPNTGLTVTGEVSLDGGAYAGVSGTIAEISDGTYQFDAASGDMNAALLTLRFSASGADDTFVHIKTAA